MRCELGSRDASQRERGSKSHADSQQPTNGAHEPTEMRSRLHASVEAGRHLEHSASVGGGLCGGVSLSSSASASSICAASPQPHACSSPRTPQEKSRLHSAIPWKASANGCATGSATNLRSMVFSTRVCQVCSVPSQFLTSRTCYTAPLTTQLVYILVAALTTSLLVRAVGPSD